MRQPYTMQDVARGGRPPHLLQLLLQLRAARAGLLLGLRQLLRRPGPRLRQLLLGRVHPLARRVDLGAAAGGVLTQGLNLALRGVGVVWCGQGFAGRGSGGGEGGGQG